MWRAGRGNWTDIDQFGGHSLKTCLSHQKPLLAADVFIRANTSGLVPTLERVSQQNNHKKNKRLIYHLISYLLVRFVLVLSTLLDQVCQFTMLSSASRTKRSSSTLRSDDKSNQNLYRLLISTAFTASQLISPCENLSRNKDRKSLRVNDTTKRVLCGKQAPHSFSYIAPAFGRGSQDFSSRKM